MGMGFMDMGLKHYEEHQHKEKKYKITYPMRVLDKECRTIKK